MMVAGTGAGLWGNLLALTSLEGHFLRSLSRRPNAILVLSLSVSPFFWGVRGGLWEVRFWDNVC
jgi:hypothetical protein